MICTCTCAHACILMHTDVCKRVQQKNTRLQNNAKKFIHLCECVLAFLCVCVFVGASQCLTVCACVCVRVCVWARHSPIAAATRAKFYRHSKWRYNLVLKNNNALHIFTKYIKFATNLLFCTRNSQIKSLNVFVPMRQCMHVWVCVRLSVFANFVAGNFHTKLLLTCVI